MSILQANQLRDEFDRSFAEPLRAEKARGLPALAIRVGSESEDGHRWVLPLDRISNVTKKRKIAFVPGGPPSQLGLSGVQGQLLAVHSLAGLLNYPIAEPSETQWLAVIRSDEIAIALGFEKLDGQVRLPPESIQGANQATVVQLPNEMSPRPMVDVAALVLRLIGTSAR